jgi:hypothetical protein
MKGRTALAPRGDASYRGVIDLVGDADVIERLVRLAEDLRIRQWELNDGPTRPGRWALRHPLVTTLVVAVILGVALGLAFGVPPVSPLVLVVILASPIYPWLVTGRQAYEAWLAGELPRDEGSDDATADGWGADGSSDDSDDDGNGGDEGGEGGGGGGGGGVEPPRRPDAGGGGAAPPGGPDDAGPGGDPMPGDDEPARREQEELAPARGGGR